jgi:hypothetical protein
MFIILMIKDYFDQCAANQCLPPSSYPVTHRVSKPLPVFVSHCCWYTSLLPFLIAV